MENNKLSVLVVDDNKEFVRDLVLFLSKEYNCFEAYSFSEALSAVSEYRPDAVLLDISLSGSVDDEQGFEALVKIKNRYPHTAVIMVSKHESKVKIDKAINLGANFYLQKKIGATELRKSIASAINNCILSRSREMLQAQNDELVYSSENMGALLEEAEEVAKTNTKVLISGETGTGKRLVAEYIHNNSARADNPFGTVNALSYDPNLIASELFGHKRGAFTGAVEDRIGILESCNRGTVFLDEISDYNSQIQTKLLDFLDRNVVQRLGSNREKYLDVRIIAATNKNLGKLVKTGKFRSDLFFRLKVKTINVPPLRERPKDIPAIARYYLRKFSIENHRFLIQLEGDAFESLVSYPWPGNVRELRHFIEGLCIKARTETYSREEINNQLDKWNSTGESEKTPDNYREALRHFKKGFFINILKRTRGNITKATEITGLQRESLYRILKSLSISKDRYK